MNDLLEFDFKTKIVKVISGGQTGADQAGLEAARLMNIDTGGMAPKGYRTESGNNLSLKELYRLDEHSSATYPPRTRINVQNSNFTLILGNPYSPGCKLTQTFCVALGKPFACSREMTDDDLQLIATKLIELQDRIVLNVAGNRESMNKGIYERGVEFVSSLIQTINSD